MQLHCVNAPACWTKAGLSHALLLTLLVVSSTTNTGVDGQPLVKPSSQVFPALPYHFVAAQQGTGLAYLGNNGNVFGVASSGQVVLGTNASSFSRPDHNSVIFEERPHNGVVWSLTHSVRLAAEGIGASGLILLNSSTLAVLRVLQFNTTAFTPPVNNLFTYTSLFSDDDSSPYIVIGCNTYILDQYTGEQTGLITAPCYDDPALGTGEGALQNQGWTAALAADGTLWLMDFNYFPNSTWPLFHLDLAGNLLSSGWIDIGPSDGLQSMALDSAGNIYVTVCTSDVSSAVIFVLDQEYNTVGNISFGITANTQLTVGAIGNYDLELSISWGSTPDEDLFYVYNHGFQPIYQFTRDAATSLIHTTPYALNVNGEIAYDAYLDSFIITQREGPYSAIRIDHAISNVLATYVLPVYEGYSAVTAVSIAVDGAGGVAFGISTPEDDGYYYGISFFQSSTLVFTVGTDTTLVAIDPATQLIYSYDNAGTFTAYNYSGSAVQTLLIGTRLQLNALHYHYHTTLGATLAMVDDTSAALSLVQLSTGAVSVLFTCSASPLIDFAFSSDSSIAFLVVGLIENGQIPRAVAVNTGTGAGIAELDLRSSPPWKQTGGSAGSDGSLAVDSAGAVYVVQRQTRSAASAGLLLFSSLTVPSSVLGDPQFVGLRGQSFQVHGLDGAVYALVSSPTTQVNARFVFPKAGRCPLVDTTSRWHPGSYMGAVSIRQYVASDALATDGVVHCLTVTAGCADLGFESITHNNRSIAVGAQFQHGAFSFAFKTPRQLQVRTEQFAFTLTSSDRFINQAVAPLMPLSRLQAHGLLGQTHSSVLHRSSLRVIEGELDEYAISGDDLHGKDFAYNMFAY